MLIGRDRAVDRVNALIAVARAGRAARLVVTGPPGIGKSLLLDHARERATGFQVLSVTGVESAVRPAFSGLGELLDPVLDRLSLLPAAEAAALRTTLGKGDDATDAGATAAAAIESLLGAVSAEGPLLVLVDDAHWLDADSREAIASAARAVGGHPIAVIAAERVHHPALSSRGFPELRLEPLERDAAEQLAQAHAPGELAPATLDRVLDAAAGNPLAIRVLAARGDADVALEDGVLARLFDADITALSPTARVAVLVAAVADDDELDPLMAAAARLGADRSGWEEAEEARILTLEPLRFAHPEVRKAVLQQATGAQRRAAHAAIADELGLREEIARAVWHRAAATVGADDATADALEALAGEYTRRSGHIGAARALERAARLSAKAPVRARRLTAAASEALRAQRIAWAERWAGEALKLTSDPQVIARAELTLAGVAAWSGRLSDAARRYRAIADRAGEREPAIASDALSRAAAVHVVQGQTGAALAAARDALTAAETSHDADAIQAARATLSSVHVLRGEIAAARMPLESAVAFYTGRDDPTGAAYVALTLAWIGEYERAARLLDEAVEYAERRKDTRNLVQALEIRADLGFRRGAWEDARTDAVRSAKLAEVEHEPVQHAYSLSTLAILHAARGDSRRTLDLVKLALRLVQGRGVEALREYTGFARGLLALGNGDPAAAFAALTPVAEYVKTTGRGTAGILFWPADYIEAAIRADKREIAERELEELERQAASTELLWARTAAARCRGLLAEPDEIDATFTTALALDPTDELPFERARTLFAYGSRLRSVRRLKDSQEPLTAAFTLFDELAAAGWAERAAAELIAGAPPTRGPYQSPATVELTPTERRVAACVQRGLTNAQIARELGRREKTIEFHLRNIFGKVGVSNRTALARWVSQQRLTPDAAAGDEPPGGAP